MFDDKTIKLVRDALGFDGDPASHRVVVAMSGGVGFVRCRRLGQGSRF